MSTEQNKAVLHQAIKNWNNGDLNAYLQLYNPDCTLHGYAGVEPGLESIRKFYEDFWVAFPDSQLELGSVVAEGDKVACNFILTATHKGNLMGIPPTGKAINNTGCTILRFANDKCVERWSQFDFLGVLQQIGVVPTPGQG